MVDDLLDTAQELLDAATPESRTDRADVLAEWLHTLLIARLPDAVAERIALTDPETGAPLEQIVDRARIVLRVRVDDAAVEGERLLTRLPAPRPR